MVVKIFFLISGLPSFELFGISNANYLVDLLPSSFLKVVLVILIGCSTSFKCITLWSVFFINYSLLVFYITSFTFSRTLGDLRMLSSTS